MPDQLQLRGGTTSEHTSFTGVSKEVTVDTTKQTLVVHDGSTAGGTPLMRENGSNAGSSVGIGTGGSNAIEISNGQDIKFLGADGTKHFFFDKSAGNIGVGTITPAERMHLSTSGGATTTIRMDTNTNACRVKAKVVGGENHLVLSSNNDADSVVITGNSVGIGTTPDKLFHVERNDDSTTAIAKFKNAGTGDATLQIGNADRNFVIGMDNSDSDKFKLGFGDALQSITGFTIDTTGKVGIGTSTPNSQSRLDVAGKINLSGLDTAFVSNGQPLIYRSGSDQGSYPFNTFGHLILQARGDGSNRDIVFATGTSGANKTVIDSSGNLGIGTTTARDKLEIKGANNGYSFRVNAEAQIVKLLSSDNTGATQGGFRFATDNGSTELERCRIDTDGDFLVGLTDALSTQTGSIQAAGPIIAKSYINAHTSNAAVLQYISNKAILRSYGATANSGIIQFNVGGGGDQTDFSAMTIDESGQVGIGVADPSVLLHLKRTSTTGYSSAATTGDTTFLIENDGAAGHATMQFQVLSGGTANTGQATISAFPENASSKATALGFGVRNEFGSVKERVRVTSTGDLLIGRTSSGNTGNGHIIRGGDSAIFSRDSSGETVQVCRNDSNGDLIQFRTGDSGNAAICGEIVRTGATTVAYNTESDYRLKENEVAISDGITRLKLLKPYRFNFKAEPSKTVDGFFAHEVTPAVPEAIYGEKDDPNRMQGIDQSKLVPLLVAAVQELIGKVEALEAA